MKPILTKDLLHELFEYKDGILYWKVDASDSIKAGCIAGSKQKNGYRALSFKGVRERAHRVIWIMHNNLIPFGYQIDHEDNNPSNDLISNLRLAESWQNTANRRLVKSVNKSGYKGVFYVPHAKKWRVQIKVKHKCKSLGYYHTPEEGYEVYKKAAKKLHGEFANY